MLKVGDLEVHVLADGGSELPAHIYGEHAGHHGEEISENGVMRLPISAFLIRTAGKNILIDAGLGPVRHEFPMPNGRMIISGGELPQRLAALGVYPEDIDHVIATHLHLDHAGWLIQDRRRFFPNATIRFGAGDWEEQVMNSHDAVFREGMIEANAAGRIVLIEKDGELFPGISAMHTPGHTAGHTSFVLSSGGERAIVLGDILSCPMQLRNIEMEVILDTDPALAVKTRDRIARELDGDPNLLVGGPHFPGLRFGRVLMAEGRRYWS